MGWKNRLSKLTEELEESVVCLRLDVVPRVFATQTSNPLSAKMYAKQSFGGRNNHVAPSCMHHTYITFDF